MARKKKLSVNTPSKACPKCEARVHARKMACDNCGYKFPSAKKKVAKKARRAVAAPAAATTEESTGVDVAAVIAAQRLIQRLGGVSAAKQMVDAVAREL